MSKPNCDCLAPLYRRFEAGEDPERVMPWDLSGVDPECIAELCIMYIKYGGQTRKERAKELMRYAGR